MVPNTNIDLYTLHLLYTKKEYSNSMIELQMDKKMHGLDGIVLNHLQSKFDLSRDMNSYIIQNEVDDLFLLDMIKGLRQNGWKMIGSMTSNFIDNNENIVKTKFSFEKKAELIK